MTNYAQTERQALCDTMERVGPDAPTLCHPWRVRELAAHLVIRETRPDLALGMFVGPLRGRMERSLLSKAAGDFPTLLEALRSGPPKWTPAALSPVDQALNTMEFFIHHEDVLRAQPDWKPRVLMPGQELAIWSGLTTMAFLLYRRADVGIILETPMLLRHAVRGPSAAGTVVVKGAVGDLALFSYGRKSAARVAFEGSPAAIDVVKKAGLSLG